MKIQEQAFTLVEILVAITIFGIMMISVMGVYLTSTEVTYKADLNRFMQENVKNIVTNISEDIMQNGVEGIKNVTGGTPATAYSNTEGFALKTGNNKRYELVLYDKDESDISSRFRLTSVDMCSKQTPRNHCMIVLVDGSNFIPVTNDLVTVEDIQYRLTGMDSKTPQKLTVFLTLAIAPRIGVREDLIKSTKVHTQFTVSVRNSMVQ